MSKSYRTTAVTFAAAAITGITDVSVTEQATEQTLIHTDAADAVQAAHIGGLHATIAVTSTDLSKRSSLTVGTAGALVVTRTLRANGKGDSATVQTETYAGAVYTGCTDGAPTEGASTVTYNFIAISSDGSSGGVVAYS